MKISKDDIIKVSELARLEFKEEELEKFTEQLGNILEYIEQLNELNTDNVEPTSHVLDISTPLREDKVVEWLSTEEVLKNAPESEDDFFVVPQVIED
ncbi:MAG: Asp-tRNA(Asn)/Glu-tRNA(Gln) amidotransferase subunit GatC [Candidatus Dadabacteria bacterium]|jgi:aspartyl-tRNA(Asn)/glutamyl-tRNA(Gln) amidotransferase subunit C|nr:Asp-tRNA(Asn)/Glu-tRNA(Gln) amidotransferase subunit GatC [Candidatus Dadabacteria bacterium]MCZ6638355.1 Asp-tRNA(Asn)/Glu-tRNA(Gln) amidotransferase subunit GatC [Candidatus Dadabacteria bacterium]MCZ6685613.1 Asp-tRNA(Asn)/Glu-tRNA(Gln) amidotransferase subunit GatC [Candidatus Dadabacteria bacterium]MCZ6791359.1 Asp-tRNA(Asn)/Glu-tRNA(Gln) amidotransferase subunit GatC [Candidatus Dadabacteria bacterium]MCZ6865467.1 Asp-tRNA(Asn)/Glu-tRNA(Gln) amidotransferase subunit GatC [Candidatus Da